MSHSGLPNRGQALDFWDQFNKQKPENKTVVGQSREKKSLRVVRLHYWAEFGSILLVFKNWLLAMAH